MIPKCNVNYVILDNIKKLQSASKLSPSEKKFLNKKKGLHIFWAKQNRSSSVKLNYSMLNIIHYTYIIIALGN